MKKNKYLLILSFFLFSFNNTEVYYQTECITLQTEGYISINIWDTKSGKSYKSAQARKDAIYAILYSGIQGNNNCTTQKAILNNSQEIDNFKKIEKDFFSTKGKWAEFTASSTIESTLPINLGNKNWKVYQVNVSKDALKKYLEEKSIIMSLNKGF
jgi:hypothetical protein